MTKVLDEKNLIKLSDISLCSALCVCGYNIQKIQKQTSGKAIFLIEKDEKTDDLIRKFFNHELKVDALSYFNFLKEIKTRIYNI